MPAQQRPTNGLARLFSGVNLAAAALLVTTAAVTLALAAQDPPAKPEDPSEAGSQPEPKPVPAPEPAIETGLRGILPGEVPEPLTAEEFAVLAGNWTKWSGETADVVAKLYDESEVDVAAQREVVALLRHRLTTMENSLADRRYRSIWDPLTTMHGRLLRRVDLAEAALDTLELTPEKVRARRLEQAGGGITDSLRKLRGKLESIRGGTAWLPVVQADKLPELMQNAANDEAALPVLQEVQKRLTDTESLSDAQKKFLARPEFVAVGESIGVYVERAKEEQPPLDAAQLRAELARLVAAAEDFEADGKLASAAEVEAALAAIGKLTPDQGRRISGVIDKHFRNDNFHVVASEEVLSRYVAETRRESEPIAEQTQDAYVTGRQTTTAVTGVDMRQRADGALFDLTLRGVTRASTIANASRATISAIGRHTFVARRAVLFTGDEFKLGSRSVMSVNPNITITGASTSYDGGMFAGTARRRAMGVANSRRYESERTSARKIRERVQPEFDRDVVKQIAQANKDIEAEWNARLREARLEPVERHIRSTDAHLLYSSRVARKGELSGGVTTLPPAPQRGLSVHVHETMLDAMFDRMNVAGRTMTEAEFRKEVDDYLNILLPKAKADPKATAGVADSGKPAAGSEAVSADTDLYVFADVDPVRFHADSDEVLLVLRAGIRQEGKQEIPTQKITVRLTFRLEGDQIVIERDSVKVAAVERPDSRLEQVARAKIMTKKIENALTTQTRPRAINLSRGEGKDDLVLNVTRIGARNGWISIRAE